jgi:hypothetical protein
MHPYTCGGILLPSLSLSGAVRPTRQSSSVNIHNLTNSIPFHRTRRDIFPFIVSLFHAGDIAGGDIRAAYK